MMAYFFSFRLAASGAAGNENTAYVPIGEVKGRAAIMWMAFASLIGMLRG